MPNQENYTAISHEAYRSKTQTDSSKKRGWKIVVFVLIIGLLLCAIFYFYSKYQEDQKILKNPVIRNQLEADSIITKVGRLITLPKGEKPSVAVVSDKAKLSKDAFFAKAENGDEVLIYLKAKRAILYRPSTNKIIEVTLINPDNSNSASPSATIVPSQTLSETPTPPLSSTPSAAPTGSQ